MHSNTPDGPVECVPRIPRSGRCLCSGSLCRVWLCGVVVCWWSPATQLDPSTSHLFDAVRLTMITGNWPKAVRNILGLLGCGCTISKAPVGGFTSPNGAARASMESRPTRRVVPAAFLRHEMSPGPQTPTDMPGLEPGIPACRGRIFFLRERPLSQGIGKGLIRVPESSSKVKWSRTALLCQP